MILIFPLFVHILENEEIRSIRKYRQAKQNYHKISNKINVKYHEADLIELENLRKNIKKQHQIDNWKFAIKIVITISITTAIVLHILYINDFQIFKFRIPYLYQKKYQEKYHNLESI